MVADPEVTELFSTAMKMKRRAMQLTLAELADQVGLGNGGHSHLSRIERGIITPRLDLAVQIAKMLDIDLEVLKG